MTLSLADVSKRYGGTEALSDISLDVLPGRVHALVGENGAGKSTCLGVLGGRIQPSTGAIYIDGEEVTISSPRHAAQKGIVSIYQELSVIPTLTAVENVYLGQEIRRNVAQEDRPQMVTGYEQLASRLGLAIPPDAEVGGLSIGDQQMIEIMRALVRQPRAILLDEPTAALGPRERQALYGVIGDLKSRGVMVVFVSHNLDEVLAISDDISVFRDGQLCETRTADGWTRDALMISMVGHVPVSVREPSEVTDGAPLLRVSALEDSKIRGIDFELRAGEIVGIAGLVGSGRSSLLRLLAGATPPTGGTLHLDGEPVSWPRSVQQARQRGIAFLTEDRKQSGIIPEASALENIVLGNLRAVTKWGVVSRPLVSGLGRVAARSVKFADDRLLDTINTLSGGNQQKALLARIVHFAPKIFLADEPTRGVDVGAKAEITATLRGIAREGSAVLLVSSEFEELVENCHRVLVLWGGQIVDELTGHAITIDSMVSKAFGPER